MIDSAKYWSAGASWNNFISHDFPLSLFAPLPLPLLGHFIPFVPPSASSHNSFVPRTSVWISFQRRRDILQTAGGRVTCQVEMSSVENRHLSKQRLEATQLSWAGAPHGPGQAPSCSEGTGTAVGA